MPNLLFISYSRKQQHKAIEIDNIKLRQFYWWMDYRIVGTVDWWKNICEAIEESYCLVAILSKSYMESVYCMGELEYALKLNKPILCFKIDSDAIYPKELEDKRIQYISIDKWNITDIIQSILEAMHQVERDYNNKVYHKDLSLRPYLRPDVPVPAAKTESKEDLIISKKIDKAATSIHEVPGVDECIIRAIQELNKDNYQKVIDLLAPVRPLAKDNNQETIQELLREARLGQEYAMIAALVTAKSRTLQKRGCEQYVEFREAYPDYSDDMNLGNSCQSLEPTAFSGKRRKQSPITGRQRIDRIVMERNRSVVYESIKSLAEKPSTAGGAKAAWKAFERDYPNYDPDKLAARLAKLGKKISTAHLNEAEPLPDTDTDLVKTDEVRKLAEQMAKHSGANPIPDVKTNLLKEDEAKQLEAKPKAQNSMSFTAAKMQILPNIRTEPLSKERREQLVNEALALIEAKHKKEAGTNNQLPDVKTELLQVSEDDKIKNKLMYLQGMLAEMHMSMDWEDWPQEDRATFEHLMKAKVLPEIETMITILEQIKD